jgi:hypothetical protein
VNRAVQPALPATVQQVHASAESDTRWKVGSEPLGIPAIGWRSRRCRQLRRYDVRGDEQMPSGATTFQRSARDIEPSSSASASALLVCSGHSAMSD